MKEKNRALFLDRDGVIIEDVSYPHRPEDLHLREGLIPHLKWAREQGFKLIIVTNQSGIARGIFTVDQFEAFQELVNGALRDRGVSIDGVYYCPFLEEGSVAPFDRDSEDRKPKAGMFLKAREDFSLSLEDSFMVGDKFSDRIEYPGLRSLILRSPYTEGCGGVLYEDFDALFREIEREIRTDY
ncbi:MAG: HAD family hydrolase [Spirochaetales bacterium]|nr:HAD family hydrolase [Spirochaetales bacterium]